MSFSLNSIYVMPSYVQNEQGFTAEVLADFVLTTSLYQSHDYYFNASSTNCIGVLDNSANVHLHRDKSLFAGVVEPCPQVSMWAQ